MFASLQLFSIFLLIQNPMLYNHHVDLPKSPVVRRSSEGTVMEALRKPEGQGGQVELLLLQSRQDLCFGTWRMQQAFM